MTLPELRVQEHWGLSAQNYDRRFHRVTGRLYRWREERAIERALRGLEPGSTVLDAACGTGRITSLLRHKGFRVTGCDISRRMLDVARKQLTIETSLIQSNVEYLPYRARSFDAATCIGLFMHLDADSRVRVLRELTRTSRERFIVQYGCPNTLLWAKARLIGEMPATCHIQSRRPSFSKSFHSFGSQTTEGSEERGDIDRASFIVAWPRACARAALDGHHQSNEIRRES